MLNSRIGLIGAFKNAALYKYAALYRNAALQPWLLTGRQIPGGSFSDLSKVIEECSLRKMARRHQLLKPDTIG